MATRMTYSVSFSCNAVEGWRRAIGNALRSLAERIDGRWSLAIEISTSPRLTRGDESRCIRYGIDWMAWAICEETRAEALEEILAGKEEDRHGAPA